MPHMMPMLWYMMLIFSLILFLTLLTMLYFLSYPSPSFNKPNYPLFNLTKWNWKW